MRHKSEVVRTQVGFIYRTDEDEIVQAVGTALPRPPRGPRQCRANRLDIFACAFFSPRRKDNRRLGHDFSART